jgi:DNA (cytosine-5)-methyltransferase 1
MGNATMPSNLADLPGWPSAITRDVVSVDDDDDDGEIEGDNEVHKIGQQVQALRAAGSPLSCNLIREDQDAETMAEAGLEAEIQVIDLTVDDGNEICRSVESQHYPRQPRPSYRTLDFCITTKGVNIALNKVYELDFLLGDYEIQFIAVTEIRQNRSNNKACLQGFGYTRTRKLKGQLPLKRNEVCRILEIDEDESFSSTSQSLVEVDAENILCQRYLHTTNRLFPEIRPTDEWKELVSADDVEHRAPLVCRWKYTVTYRNSGRRAEHRPVAFALEHIREEESDRRHATKETLKRDTWRCAPVVLDQGHPRNRGGARRRYMVADIFCGAGGASRGMERAGFQLTDAVDHWPHACATYRANFPRATLHEMDIFNFLQIVSQRRQQQYPDVLHISPPCQVWSPAHTIPGRNDLVNEAVLFACSEVIRKLRPRIFTVEQTFGILHSRFKGYFNVLVQQFTLYGYSVRWRVIHFETLGLPQPRKRLVMIGSCPGEKLPTFPRATHGTGPGLQPMVTVAATLARIRPGADDLHRVASMKALEKPPWDANRIIPRTITCGGSDWYHPSGKRDFSPREYALLQGFPIFHKFKRPCVKKQIGNAFPPCVVKILYEHIKKHLQREDGHNTAHLPTPPATPAEQPYFVELDGPLTGQKRRASVVEVGSADAVKQGDEIICRAGRPVARNLSPPLPGNRRKRRRAVLVETADEEAMVSRTRSISLLPPEQSGDVAARLQRSGSVDLETVVGDNDTTIAEELPAVIQAPVVTMSPFLNFRPGAWH